MYKMIYYITLREDFKAIDESDNIQSKKTNEVGLVKQDTDRFYVLFLRFILSFIYSIKKALSTDYILLKYKFVLFYIQIKLKNTTTK